MTIFRAAQFSGLVPALLLVLFLFPGSATASEQQKDGAEKKSVSNVQDQLDKILNKSKSFQKTKVTKKSKDSQKNKKRFQQGKKTKLFGTAEFKGKITKLPKWSRVLKAMAPGKGGFTLQSSKYLQKRADWKKLKTDISGKPELEKLKAVNKYFNQWPYRLDKVNYGIADYWARPIEFFSKSGDCEDYSIAKYYALKDLGFTMDKLRIVAVKDKIRGIGHAVLAAYVGDDVFILDNQTILVLSHSRYRHYVPQYSVNEKYRWYHVPQTKKTVYKKPVKNKKQ